MKQKLYILPVLAALLFACAPEEKPGAGNAVAMETDKTRLEFVSEGGEDTFTVTASEKVYVVPGENWIATRTAAGVSSDETIVTVTVSPNTSDEEREGRISVVAGEEKLYVEVHQAASGPEPLPGPEDNAAWRLAAKLGMGWNLGNQMDAHSNGEANETCWGNPATTQTAFDKIKDAGFKSVRIPVTWLGHFGEAPDYKIDEAWMNRVAEIVGYAENAGLNAIVNIHHDGADSAHWLDIKTAATDASANSRIEEQIAAIWAQIAEKFKDKGDFLIFESFNEIHDGGWGWGVNRTDGGKQYACLNGWNQVFVDAVRATGGQNASRFLAVPGYCTNADLTIENFVMPEDDADGRLIVAVHYYDPSEYTLTAKYSEWGHTAVSGKAPGSEEDVKAVFSRLNAKYVSNGIPVYLGEMGCVNRATEREQSFQQYYFEYVVKAAKTYGLSPFVWDNGATGTGEEQHAFINHGTGAYCSTGAQKAVEAMVRAMNTGDDSYTLNYVYANAPK